MFIGKKLHIIHDYSTHESILYLVVAHDRYLRCTTSSTFVPNSPQPQAPRKNDDRATRQPLGAQEVLLHAHTCRQAGGLVGRARGQATELV